MHRGVLCSKPKRGADPGTWGRRDSLFPPAEKLGAQDASLEVWEEQRSDGHGGAEGQPRHCSEEGAAGSGSWMWGVCTRAAKEGREEAACGLGTLWNPGRGM